LLAWSAVDKLITSLVGWYVCTSPVGWYVCTSSIGWYVSGDD